MFFTNKGSKGKFSPVGTLKKSFGVSLETVWAYIVGIGIAFLFYLFISGGAVRFAFMGGLAASYLAAKAAIKRGFLQKLSECFLSLFTRGKTKSSPNIQGLIRGLSAGFIAASLFGLIGVWLVHLIAVGITLVILKSKFVIKIVKEESDK
ncbi:MAG: hypothetical protein IJ800_01745 [Clostridia bacterium]|nr:hypothetical protein [Clostridia bacterium]